MVISWFLSPIFTGIISSAVYFLTRLCVLRRENSVKLAYITFPLIFGVTLFLIVLAILLKGIPKEDLPW